MQHFCYYDTQILTKSAYSLYVCRSIVSILFCIIPLMVVAYVLIFEVMFWTTLIHYMLEI